MARSPDAIEQPHGEGPAGTKAIMAATGIAMNKAAPPKPQLRNLDPPWISDSLTGAKPDAPCSCQDHTAARQHHRVSYSGTLLILLSRTLFVSFEQISHSETN